MRNDLVYMRFYWDDPADEVLPDRRLREVVSTFEDLFKSVVRAFSIRRATLFLTQAGPPQRHCIEVAFAAEIATELIQAGGDVFQDRHRDLMALIKITDDHEGFVAFCSIALSLLFGPVYWRVRKNDSRDDRWRQESAGSTMMLTEVILRDPAVNEALTQYLFALRKTGADKVEMQVRDEPPGVIDGQMLKGKPNKGRKKRGRGKK